MPSPFPGFDPFLEAQGYWKEFHTEVPQLDAVRPRRAQSRTPTRFGSRSDSRWSTRTTVPIARFSPTSRSSGLRDRRDRDRRPRPRRPWSRSSWPSQASSGGGDRETDRDPPLPEPRAGDGHRAALAEQQATPGDRLYYEKRLELIHQQVHLVELDLLIGGQRLPMEDELPEGHYYAFVSRAERRFLSDTYAWTIRDPLPSIPIPLKAPDPDILARPGGDLRDGLRASPVRAVDRLRRAAATCP